MRRKKTKGTRLTNELANLQSDCGHIGANSKLVAMSSNARQKNKLQRARSFTQDEPDEQGFTKVASSDASAIRKSYHVRDSAP